MAITASDCSSDALSLQNTPAHHNLSSADQDSGLTILPNDCSRPPAVIKKPRRGRPPIYNFSDKRKAQLKKVAVLSLLVLKMLRNLAQVCDVISLPCSALSS